MSGGAPAHELRISQRLRDALVADYVLDDLDNDYWLGVPLRDPEEWTGHLARQLRIDDRAVGIHETLLLFIPELDQVLRDWPPQRDLSWCRDLAHQATKNMDDLELFSTLLAGPEGWAAEKVPDCTYAHLERHIRPRLRAGLAAELHRLLGNWEKWDVRHLADSRRRARGERRQQLRPLPGRAGHEHRRERFDPRAFFQPPPKV